MKIEGMKAQTDSVPQTKTTTNDEKIIQQNNNQIKVPAESLIKADRYTKDEMSVSDKAVIDAIEKANKALDGPNRRFEFSIHKKTHEIMVKVRDNDTGEIVKEFPPEKILDMVAKLWEMAGIMVDERR